MKESFRFTRAVVIVVVVTDVSSTWAQVVHAALEALPGQRQPITPNTAMPTKTMLAKSRYMNLGLKASCAHPPSTSPTTAPIPCHNPTNPCPLLCIQVACIVP